jgi:hypothetical protein
VLAPGGGRRGGFKVVRLAARAVARAGGTSLAAAAADRNNPALRQLQTPRRHVYPFSLAPSLAAKALAAAALRCGLPGLRPQPCLPLASSGDEDETTDQCKDMETATMVAAPWVPPPELLEQEALPEAQPELEGSGSSSVQLESCSSDRPTRIMSEAPGASWASDVKEAEAAGELAGPEEFQLGSSSMAAAGVELAAPPCWCLAPERPFRAGTAAARTIAAHMPSEARKLARAAAKGSVAAVQARAGLEQGKAWPATPSGPRGRGKSRAPPEVLAWQPAVDSGGDGNCGCSSGSGGASFSGSGSSGQGRGSSSADEGCTSGWSGSSGDGSRRSRGSHGGRKIGRPSCCGASCASSSSGGGSPATPVEGPPPGCRWGQQRTSPRARLGAARARGAAAPRGRLGAPAACLSESGSARPAREAARAGLERISRATTCQQLPTPSASASATNHRPVA